MPDNWIGTILLTDETEVSVNDVKVNDLIELNDVGGAVVPVDEEEQTILWGKLGGVTTGDAINLPNMTPPTGSHKRYKIIADMT